VLSCEWQSCGRHYFFEQLFDRKRECDTRGVLSCEWQSRGRHYFFEQLYVEKESATQEACSPVKAVTWQASCSASYSNLYKKGRMRHTRCAFL